MKKTILILGMLVAFNMLMAQNGKGQRARVRIEEYKERLNLSDEQTEQLKDLKSKYRPQFKAIREDESKSKSDKMRASADLMDERETELDAILDDKQMAELKVIRQEMRDKAKERRASKRGKR